eukprot:CAMPEP_0204313180 /NCGR_PEP_ID=MMETSP0469-20131031/3428_1 /ASSEMBLY_ACC=CAM_ASM_000384 /TAXON_ID=2969 /ORGANISM="Oxyrrhis marina" /LENGTH=144 /DNA_ID=CAMNT_0051293423 /DNA_START=30 /DNA_END=464 /DNA_ORIENTATION=+
MVQDPSLLRSGQTPRQYGWQQCPEARHLALAARREKKQKRKGSQYLSRTTLHWHAHLASTSPGRLVQAGEASRRRRGSKCGVLRRRDDRGGGEKSSRLSQLSVQDSSSVCLGWLARSRGTPGKESYSSWGWMHLRVRLMTVRET